MPEPEDCSDSEGESVDSEAERQLREQQEREERREDLRRRGLPVDELAAFQKLVEKRFTSLLRAWNEALDLKQSGFIHQADIARVARKVGFTHDLDELWTVGLNRRLGGSAELHHFAPAECRRLGNFRTALRQQFGGDLLRAWQKLMDPDGKGLCLRKTFLDAADRIRFQEVADRKAVYSWLDYDRCGFVTLAEIDGDAHEQLLKGGVKEELPMKIPKTSMTFMQRQKSMKADVRRQVLGRNHRRKVEKALEARRAANCGASDLDGFHKALLRKHGNLMRAWKEGLDLDGSGSICWAEFCQACRNEGFNGNIKTLWQQLDEDGSGQVGLDEIFPNEGLMMVDFKARLVEKYGSILEAWCTVLDEDGSGTVTKEDFVGSCKTLGVPVHDAKKIFHWIDFDRSGVITLDELDEEANAAFMRGERTTAFVDTRLKTELPFLERQFTPAMLKHAAEQRERKAKLQAAGHARRSVKEATKLDSFLRKKYGSTRLGWEELWYKAGLIPEFGEQPAGMCPSGERPVVEEAGRAGWGTMRQSDFKVALKQARFQGHVEKLWAELDPGKSNYTGLPRLKQALHSTHAASAPTLREPPS